MRVYSNLIWFAMQIYALDSEGKVITSLLADRGKSYTCPECGLLLNLRGGTKRGLHFYHKGNEAFCRHAGKSKRHTKIQEHIKKKLAPSEIFVEHPFPEIKRIADVFWPSKKIVFEIQCSPISAKEVSMRTCDYAKMGCSVVWILHDKLFNQRRLLGAEKILKNNPHYFVSASPLRGFFIYDQYALISFNKRVRKTKKLPLDLAGVCFEKKQFSGQLPEDRKKWSLYFKGDLVDRAPEIIPFLKPKKPFFRHIKSLYLAYLEKITN